MSLFGAALRLCGLTVAEAASWLGVSAATARHWSAGTRPPPPTAWQDLAALHQRIERAAAHMAASQSVTSDATLPAGADEAAQALARLMRIRNGAPEH